MPSALGAWAYVHIRQIPHGMLQPLHMSWISQLSTKLAENAKYLDFQTKRSSFKNTLLCMYLRRSTKCDTKIGNSTYPT